VATVPALQERCGAANLTRSPKPSPSGKTLGFPGSTSTALQTRCRFRFANFLKHSYLTQFALNEAGRLQFAREAQLPVGARHSLPRCFDEQKRKCDQSPAPRQPDRNSIHQSLTCAKELRMSRKAMLWISIVGGLVGLTAQPSGAGALTSGGGDRILASSEKTATEVPPPRARTGRHYRHRGGRHPFYGSGH
jgi:hypothetical protein